MRAELHPSRPTGESASPRRRGSLRLERRNDGRLWATRDGQSRSVRVCRCFPWSEPGRLISLRDEEDEEFAWVQDPGDLDPDSRRAFECALAEAGFVLEVTRVVECEEEVEIRRWRVETRQGPRSFQTRRDDWPVGLPGGGWLVRDVAGDLFLVRRPEELDAHSRELLWAFVD
ncbi:MAG: DUF1854 domain-containing protein [Myxococcota bacterium]